MTIDTKELIARRAEILAELERTDKALAEVQAAQHKEAVARILADISAAGLTQDDLFPRAAKKASHAPKGSRGVVPAKYRNPKTGDAWSGRGKKPRWLVAELAAGRTIEEFAV